MSKRTVTLKLTSQRDLIKHESGARTFGELKSELTNVKWDGMKVVVKEGRQTLELDDAILPATDFLVFLVPQKVKSGSVEKLDNIDSATYNELRSHGSFLNRMRNAQINLTGSTEDLRKALKAYYAGGQTAEDTEDLVGTIEAARAKINEAIDAIIANVGVTPADTTEYVVKVSMDDLEEELKEIKSKLKL